MSEVSKETLARESDIDGDEEIADGFVEPLYERGWLPGVEDREEYRPGGFHPVHIGDTFGTFGQYRVIHKLGSGGLATVWLCRDDQKSRYVALKIIIADESKDTPSELRLVDRDGLNSEHDGAMYISIPKEHFWHDGPNGRHLCLILPVLGPRVTRLWRNFEKPASVSRDVTLQATRGLNFLHKNGICHGDFRPANILLQLKGFDELSEDEIIMELGEPNKEPLLTLSGVSPRPSGPEYLVEGLDLDRLGSGFISDQISIIDFGESYDRHSPPEDLGIAAAFRPPELLFDNTIGIGCDLWALACTLYEIRTRSPLFENYFDSDDDVIKQMVPLLGKLPEPWWSNWKEREVWYEEDGTPLLNPDTGKPYMLLDTIEELLSGKSSEDLEGEKNGAGGFYVSKKESEILADLLLGLLKYDPKKRLSVEAVLEHPWFK